MQTKPSVPHVRILSRLAYWLAVAVGLAGLVRICPPVLGVPKRSYSAGNDRYGQLGIGQDTSTPQAVSL